MSKQRPTGMAGLGHVALNVQDLARCEQFYIDVLGMSVEWRPDADNVYLSTGKDNLALHRKSNVNDHDPQRLDHIGFFLDSAQSVDDWCVYLVDCGVPMKTEPKNHRDGARSFYCFDPEHNLVQMIYYPPLADRRENGVKQT